jgi:hypothetical protein
MSAADIANRHFTAALVDAKAEGLDTDAPCSSLLIVSTYLETRSMADVQIGITPYRRQTRSRYGLRLHTSVEWDATKNALVTPRFVGAVLASIRRFILNRGKHAMQNKTANP